MSSQLLRSSSAPNAGSFSTKGDFQLAPRRARPERPHDCTHILIENRASAERAACQQNLVHQYFFATDRSPVWNFPCLHEFRKTEWSSV